MTTLDRAALERIHATYNDGHDDTAEVRDLAASALSLMDERDTLLVVRVEEIGRYESRIKALDDSRNELLSEANALRSEVRFVRDALAQEEHAVSELRKQRDAALAQVAALRETLRSVAQDHHALVHERGLRILLADCAWASCQSIVALLATPASEPTAHDATLIGGAARKPLRHDPRCQHPECVPAPSEDLGKGATPRMSDGMRLKYRVTYPDSSPLDTDDFIFVLRYDRDAHARVALRAYAASVREENPALADDLTYVLDKLRTAMPLSGDEGTPETKAWEGEHCQSCGQSYKYYWWCDDAALWQKVTGEDGDGGLRCIPCFHEEAAAMGLAVEFRAHSFGATPETKAEPTCRRCNSDGTTRRCTACHEHRHPALHDYACQCECWTPAQPTDCREKENV